MKKLCITYVFIELNRIMVWFDFNSKCKYNGSLFYLLRPLILEGSERTTCGIMHFMCGSRKYFQWRGYSGLPESGGNGTRHIFGNFTP